MCALDINWPKIIPDCGRPQTEEEEEDAAGRQAGGSTPKASVIASSDANDVVGGIEWDIPLNFRQIDWFAFNGHKSRRVGCQPASQPLPQVKQLYSSSGGMDWNWAETERDRG